MIDPGLCASCKHAKVIETKRGSIFYMCNAPGLPKYPNLPVRACPAYEKKEPRK
jgi:hypothetical protein